MMSQLALFNSYMIVFRDSASNHLLLLCSCWKHFYLISYRYFIDY